MQANSGKVPAAIGKWKKDHGGTHAVMATAYVKKDGDKNDVNEGLTEGVDNIKS